MAEIVGDDGGRPSKQMAIEFEEIKKDIAMEAIQYWKEESDEWLEQAAQNRATIDSEGRMGRKANGLYNILESSTEPEWDSGDESASFEYNHEGAVYQEYGAMPHEIRAKRAEVLAFEWPDAPDEVKEQFSHTEGDLVFFESVDHPGIPAIGFLRHGRRKAFSLLEDSGHDVEVTE